jgi:hypothetical protein
MHGTSKLKGGSVGERRRHIGVSTRFDGRVRDPAQLAANSPRRATTSARIVDEVAEVAHARRELMLRVHRFRLRAEDLEDCYAQATLELVAQAGRGRAFASRLHIANALEQRFKSRIDDRRRALSGRSPMAAAIEQSAPLLDVSGEPIELVDPRSDLEQLVSLREELRRIGRVADRLSLDQRLVLASQIAQEGCAAFCATYGWSPEKYRKVAQRGRVRLRELLEEDGSDGSLAALAAARR